MIIISLIINGKKMKNTKFTSRKTLGKVDGKNIYLSAPSWDCDWYWGFGYLGNNHCYYNLDGLMKNTNLYDGIREHFSEQLCKELQDDNTLWKFCELIKTFYTLKETAEVFGRGGSNYDKNMAEDVLLDAKKAEEINTIVLPRIFDEIEKLF